MALVSQQWLNGRVFGPVLALVIASSLGFTESASAQTNPFTGEPAPQGPPAPLPQPAPTTTETQPLPGAPAAPAAGVPAPNTTSNPSPPPYGPGTAPPAQTLPAQTLPAQGGYANQWAPPPPPDPRPKYLPYHPGEATPAGYVYDERARRGPIIGGLITFAVPYSLSLLVAAQDSANKKTLLLIPALGPWLTLLARDSSCDPNLPIHDCTEDGATRMVLVIDGMLQTAGLIMAATGFLNPQKRFVRADWAPQVAVIPRFVGSSPGLGVVGQF